MSLMKSRSEEHTSELQSPYDLVCRLLLEKKEVWVARYVLGDYSEVKGINRDKFEHDRPFKRDVEGSHKFEPISLFFLNDTATTEIYTLSLHDALPICASAARSTSSRLRNNDCWTVETPFSASVRERVRSWKRAKQSKSDRSSSPPWSRRGVTHGKIWASALISISRTWLRSQVTLLVNSRRFALIAWSRPLTRGQTVETSPVSLTCPLIAAPRS